MKFSPASPADDRRSGVAFAAVAASLLGLVMASTMLARYPLPFATIMDVLIGTIARALAQDAPIIVMDEPTAGLDLGNQGRVLSLFRDLSKSGKAVIMTTHPPNQAFVLDCRVALMKAGKILGCGSAAAFCNEATMSSLYGAPLLELSDPMRNGLAAYVPDIGQNTRGNIA